MFTNDKLFTIQRLLFGDSTVFLQKDGQTHGNTDGAAKIVVQILWVRISNPLCQNMEKHKYEYSIPSKYYENK